MTLEQVKLMRTLHEGSLSIFADNAKIINTNLDKTHIIWDDNNELVHVIRTNTNHYTQYKTPIIVESLAYETIQYISSVESVESLNVLLTQLKSQSLIDDEKISMILKDYKK